MLRVVDAAVQKAYAGKRRIHWMEIYAGEKSTRVYGRTSGCRRRRLSVLKTTSSRSRGR